MILTATNSDQALREVGFVVFPDERYVDLAHGIDWAVILWRCEQCGSERHAPGPGEPCHCSEGHGPMKAVR